MRTAFTALVNQAWDFGELNLIYNGVKKKIFLEVFIIKEFGKSVCDTEFFTARAREQSKYKRKRAVIVFSGSDWIVYKVRALEIWLVSDSESSV